jgi:hypothetical protein
MLSTCEDIGLRVQGLKFAPPLLQRPLVIHCYGGGCKGNQALAFASAVSKVEARLKGTTFLVEYMTCKTVREQSFTETDFVNWLLSSHIHFVIGHVHQGTGSTGWTLTRLYGQLQRLKYHPGFPSSDYLSCPIWTQDKIRYLTAMQDDAILPSLRINLWKGMSIIDETTQPITK